jgi:GxxExxY protein
MYEEALKFELEQRGFSVRRQIGFKVVYKGHELDKRLVIDLIVNDLVIVEAKAVADYHRILSLNSSPICAKQTNALDWLSISANGL